MNTAAENDLTSGQIDAHLIAQWSAQYSALQSAAGQAADAT